MKPVLKFRFNEREEVYPPLKISVGDMTRSIEKYLYPTGIFITEGLIGELSTK